MILAAAEQSWRTLAVGLVLRFFAEYAEIERRVASGEIGAVRSVSAYRLSFPADWADWIGDPVQTGGTPVDLMVHDFDQLNPLEEPRLRTHRTGRRGSRRRGRRARARTGLAEGSMLMPPSYPFSAGIRILGEKGVLEHGFRAAPRRTAGTSARTSRASCDCTRATVSRRRSRSRGLTPGAPRSPTSSTASRRAPGGARDRGAGARGAQGLARDEPLAGERQTGGGVTTSARSSPASMRFATKRSLFSRTSSGGLDDAEPPGRRP